MGERLMAAWQDGQETDVDAGTPESTRAVLRTWYLPAHPSRPCHPRRGLDYCRIVFATTTWAIVENRKPSWTAKAVQASSRRAGVRQGLREKAIAQKTWQRMHAALPSSRRLTPLTTNPVRGDSLGRAILVGPPHLLLHQRGMTRPSAGGSQWRCVIRMDGRIHPPPITPRLV